MIDINTKFFILILVLILLNYLP